MLIVLLADSAFYSSLTWNDGVHAYMQLTKIYPNFSPSVVSKGNVEGGECLLLSIPPCHCSRQAESSTQTSGASVWLVIGIANIGVSGNHLTPPSGPIILALLPVKCFAECLGVSSLGGVTWL